MPSLAEITSLVIDMDGVLYKDDVPMPHLSEFMGFLREKKIEFICATNNSTRKPEAYSKKLARLDVEVPPGQILTSGLATGRYLTKIYPAGTRIHVFGMPALRHAIEEAGYILADDNVEAVVASMDREITYEKLKRAAILIRKGARFIATNIDPTYPSEEGQLPGTGSMIAAIEVASGVKPEIVGKPEPLMLQLAIDIMKTNIHSTAIIGDRVETDITGGKSAGLFTICVLTGVSNRVEAEAAGTDLICDDLSHLMEIWKNQK